MLKILCSLLHIHGRVQEPPCDKNTGAIFLITNAVMFAAPLEALAETCEPNYVSLTMPVLLAVALIGAAVGGEYTFTSVMS